MPIIQEILVGRRRQSAWERVPLLSGFFGRFLITSPVSRLVTYSVMDAYRIIVVHEENHVAQAR